MIDSLYKNKLNLDLDSLSISSRMNTGFIVFDLINSFMKIPRKADIQ